MVPPGPCAPTSAQSQLPASDARVRAGGTELVRTLGACVELAKPGVGGLVILTTLCGALTAPGSIPFGRLIASLLGTSLVVAAANGFNMALERDTDALMSRTRTRPLPQGRLTLELAFAFCTATATLGLCILIGSVGTLAAMLCALALTSYVILYTPLKRVTPLALFVGAVPGALPPLIGWASVSGSLSRLAWLEFAILFVWQLPHFLAIAIFRKEEYARAGLLVLSVARGVRRTKIEMLAYSLVLLFASLAPFALGLAGIAYAIVALVSGVLFVALVLRGFSAVDARSWSRRVFFASMPYLVVLLGTLVASAAR